MRHLYKVKPRHTIDAVIVGYTIGEDDSANMVRQKYVIWKTDKEQSGAFPAYVFHYTDYSVSRKEPLKRDIRVSSSKEQIFAIMG